VLACPKDLFSVKPVDQHLWVACNNLEQGDEILNQCHVACTACGRCALDAPRGLITMENNLPHIHYEQGAGVSIVNSESMDNRKSIDRCPTGAIVWFDASGKAQRGASARHIARHAPLPAEES
jgi:electron transport complex protein RnfB